MTQPPLQIGPFRLEKHIHRNATRNLYYAPLPSGTRFQSAAAIYCLSPAHHSSQHMIELHDDYQLLKHLPGPLFPKALHYYEEQFAFAREWVDGACLREVITMMIQSQIPVQQATVYDIMLQLVDGLIFLHRHEVPIVHGRLNWEHVVLGHDGRICILGIRQHNRSNLHAFSAPEQATQTFLDWRSDQWSLGAIFVSLLLNESLYTGRPNPEYAATKGDVTHWIDRVKVQFPDAYRTVAKMLHPAAGERFSHPVHIRRALEHLIERHPNSTRHQLGQALIDWNVPVEQLPHSVATLPPPRKVLPVPEPKISSSIPEVTDMLEPAIEDFIEVTQHGVPTVNRNAQLPLTTEPSLHRTSSPNLSEEETNLEDVTDLIENDIPSPPSHIRPIPKQSTPKPPQPVPAKPRQSTPSKETTSNKNTPPTPAQAKPNSIEMSPDLQRILKETQLELEVTRSESSISPVQFSEISMTQDVFQAQQRAQILMMLNALGLLLLIWKVLF